MLLENQELRIDLKDFNGNASYAKYSSFRVSGEQENYKLTLGSFLDSTAGDLLSKYKNMPFSTHDRDNDANSMKNCAVLHRAGWWYYDCHESNLNGNDLFGFYKSYVGDIVWLGGQGHHYSYKAAEMKIRAS